MLAIWLISCLMEHVAHESSFVGNVELCDMLIVTAYVPSGVAL